MITKKEKKIGEKNGEEKKEEEKRQSSSIFMGNQECINSIQAATYTADTTAAADATAAGPAQQSTLPRRLE